MSPHALPYAQRSCDAQGREMLSCQWETLRCLRTPCPSAECKLKEKTTQNNPTLMCVVGSTSHWLEGSPGQHPPLSLTHQGCSGERSSPAAVG